jgi:hypothetical protein
MEKDMSDSNGKKDKKSKSVVFDKEIKLHELTALRNIESKKGKDRTPRLDQKLASCL